MAVAQESQEIHPERPLELLLEEIQSAASEDELDGKAQQIVDQKTRSDHRYHCCLHLHLPADFALQQTQRMTCVCPLSSCLWLQPGFSTGNSPPAAHQPASAAAAATGTGAGSRIWCTL